MEKLIQIVTDRDRSKLVPREKHFTYPMTGKTYKKTVYVRIGEDPKAAERGKKPEEAKKGRKKASPNVEKPLTPPSREEIKARTERPEKTPSEHSKLESVPRVMVHGSDIRYRILTDKEYATEQALFLYEFQTDVEKKVRSTLFKNVVGFNKPDGKFFSQMMENIFAEGGMKKLADKIGDAGQAGLSREIQNRMAKYSNQLADIYNDNNTYRNFKTLTDAFKSAKTISDKMLKGFTEDHWSGPSVMDEEGAYEAAYVKGFKGKAKTMTKKDIAKKEGEKARGPKQKGDSLAKRFENGKYAAEMWHMLQEMKDHKNPTISEKVRAFISSDPDGYAKVKALMDGKGFGKMVMKEKTVLKDFMKKSSSYIADALNAYKDLGIALPEAAKFRGKDLKSIKEPDVMKKTETPEDKPEVKPEEGKKDGTKMAKVLTFMKTGSLPVTELNGLPFKSVDIKGDVSDLKKHFSSIPDVDIHEPDAKGVTSSGVILMEPDGRMWIREVSGHYGGYEHSFAKGKTEEGLSLQQNALKEVFEEMGLSAEIVGHLGDFAGDSGTTRFYIGRRTGGDPRDAHQETSNVKLVDPEIAPKTEAGSGFLNKSRDKEIAKAIVNKFKDKTDPIVAELSKPLDKAKTETKPAETAKPSKLAPVKLEPESMGTLSKVFSIDEFNIDFSKRGGSNPGGLATHKETGKKYYFKEQKSPTHAKNEVLASALYREFGIKTPVMSLVDMGDGRLGTVSRMVENLEKFDMNNEAHVKEARKGYAVDAFMANWDVFGLGWDNLFIERSGGARRIDPGGSLLFRARGGEKGDKFGDKVVELDTFLKKDRAGEVFGENSPFGKMTDEQMMQSFKIFENVSKERIENIVDQAGFDKETTKSLKKTMGNRYDDVINRMKSLKDAASAVTRTKAERSVEIVKSRPEPKASSTGEITKEAVRATLTEIQQKTLDYADKVGAMTDDKIEHLARTYRVSKDDVKEISDMIRDKMEIRINTPLETGPRTETYKNLLKDGIFKNQFVRAAEDPEKASSLGSYCPYKGSSRDNWERNLSKGILHKNKEYVATDSGAYLPLEVAHERPVYGYVYDPKLGNSATGYGMTSFVLKKDALHRASFTINDSSGLGGHPSGSEFGTASGNEALVSKILGDAKGDVAKAKKDLLEDKHSQNYSYVEAQVYGGVDISKDVEKIVIWDNKSDYSHIVKLAEKYNLPYEVKEYKGYYRF